MTSRDCGRTNRLTDFASLQSEGLAAPIQDRCSLPASAYCSRRLNGRTRAFSPGRVSTFARTSASASSDCPKGLGSPFRWRETGGLGHVGAGVARPDPACLQHMQRGPHARSSAGAGYACSARPDLHTVCRSFPKISSALSAKVCGGSKSAEHQHEAGADPFDAREGGPWACTGGGRAARPGMFAAYAAWSAREIESQAVATLAALAQNSTLSAAHFLKSHQLVVQKFAADRDRQKGRVFARRAS